MRLFDVSKVAVFVDTGVVNRFVSDSSPPAVEIARDCARANHAQVVLFGEMFNGDNRFCQRIILQLIDYC